MRELLKAMAWGFGGGLFASLLQGFLPPGAAVLRLVTAGSLTAVWAWLGLRWIGPQRLSLSAAVFLGSLYGSIADLLDAGPWLIAALAGLCALWLTLRQMASRGPEGRAQLERRLDVLEARAAAYRRAVKPPVSSWN